MRFATPNTARHRGIATAAIKTIRMVSTTKAVFVAICRRVIVIAERNGSNRFIVHFVDYLDRYAIKPPREFTANVVTS
jgi:hypothetical protein